MIQPVLDYRNGGALMHLRTRPAPFAWSKVDDYWYEMLSMCVQDLKDTLAADSNAIGLAANQIGYNLPVIAVKFPSGVEVFVNPRITKTQGRHRGPERCLSVPDKRVVVTRARKIKLEWDTEDGEPRTRTFDGQDAVVLQHECDHLLGRLLVDYE